MDVLRSIIHAYLYIPFYYHTLTRTGTFNARRVGMVREPISAPGNPLKRSLWKHYVKQYHEASCSVASVATVINALGEVINGQAGKITQMDLLNKVKTGNWKKRMSPEGDNGKRGLPLGLLGEVVRGSLEAFQILSLPIPVPRIVERRVCLHKTVSLGLYEGQTCTFHKTRRVFYG